MPGFWKMFQALNKKKAKVVYIAVGVGVLFAIITPFMIKNLNPTNLFIFQLISFVLSTIVILPVIKQELLWRNNEFIDHNISLAKLIWANIIGTTLLQMAIMFLMGVIFYIISSAIVASEPVYSVSLLKFIVMILQLVTYSPALFFSVVLGVFLGTISQAFMLAFLHLVGNQILVAFNWKLSKGGKISFYAVVYIVYNLLGFSFGMWASRQSMVGRIYSIAKPQPGLVLLNITIMLLFFIVIPIVSFQMIKKFIRTRPMPKQKIQNSDTKNLNNSVE